MSRIYKSARGQAIDIDKIKLSNENAIAVGNMRVNARGDKLGAGGQVVAGRNQIMDQAYAVPSGGYSPNAPEVFAEREQQAAKSQAEQLFNLTNNLVETDTAEAPVADTTATRGSLASSIAKTVSVTQEPIPRPNKKTGPSRI